MYRESESAAGHKRLPENRATVKHFQTLPGCSTVGFRKKTFCRKVEKIKQ
jgi:hypothetical protein